MTVKRNLAEELQEKIFNFCTRDIDIMSDVASLGDADVKEMADLLANPETKYPFTTAEGVTFRNKTHLRRALMGTMPKKDWPAGLQASHERVIGIMKVVAPRDTGPPVSVTNNLVFLPAAPESAALPEGNRLRMRRDAHGKLQRVFDVPAEPQQPVALPAGTERE